MAGKAFAVRPCPRSWLSDGGLAQPVEPRLDRDPGATGVSGYTYEVLGRAAPWPIGRASRRKELHGFPAVAFFFPRGRFGHFQ